MLDGSGADLELARSLVEVGATVRRQGQPRAARPHLERALEILDGSGAQVTSRRADTELRAAGGRGRVRAQSGPRSLTASERRVAELAVHGHTNRHIAALLQVSVKRSNGICTRATASSRSTVAASWLALLQPDRRPRHERSGGLGAARG